MTPARVGTLADAIELLRSYHTAGACSRPAVCCTCRTVAGLRRELDLLVRPGTRAAHARIHGPLFWVRRSGAVNVVRIEAAERARIEEWEARIEAAYGGAS